MGKRLRELIREICKSNDIEILKGHVSKYIEDQDVEAEDADFKVTE